MLKSVLFILLLLSLAISCKKDNEGDAFPQSGTMTVDIHGISTTFVGTVAYVVDDGGSYRVAIRGYAKANTPSNDLAFTFECYGQISLGTYIEKTNPGQNRVMDMLYTLYIENSTLYWPEAYSHGSTTDPVTVVVTKITSTSIQGTFSAKLKSTTPGNPDVTFSNGKFNAKL
jgi:hypothetical protein